MKAFKDKDGRDWSLAIDVNARKRVLAQCDVDLFSVLEGKLIDKLIADPGLLVDVIYAVCKPEADAANITPEQFGGRLVGDAIDSATTALIEDLIDFFPRVRRQVIRKAVDKMQAVETAGMEMAAAGIGKMDVGKLLQRAQAEMDAVLRKTLGDSAGGSPGSAGSTQDP